jgi:hypothetical protein
MLGLEPGDKVILRIHYEGGSGMYFFRPIIVVTKDDYEGARKLMKEEGLKLHEIFGIQQNESIMTVGGPMYNAVRNGKLGTWVSVPIYKNDANEDVCAKYYIENIIFKTPPVYMQVMQAVDSSWFNYTNKDDEKANEGVKLLDEQMLLTIANKLDSSKYIDALKLLHATHGKWSYKRMLNVIGKIKELKLKQTYGYHNESKT